MNSLIVLAGLVAVAVASRDYSSYVSGAAAVTDDNSGKTVPLMGFDQNYDGLPDKFDADRDGHPDKGYGYRRGYRYGLGYGYGYGFNARHAFDRHGKTVPLMGKDQNNDGIADFKDRNRDGKEDKYYYGGYGPYGYPGYHYGGYYGNRYY